MSSPCVYSCSHPLWGGGGICHTTDDSNVQNSCVCDPSYASRDSFGNPSCVPRKIMAPGGFLTKLMKEAVERNSFILGGFSNMGGMVLLILSSALVFGKHTILTTIHLVNMAGGASVALVSASVTVFLARAIDSAASKAPQAWYGRARKNVWRQGIAVFLSCTVSCVALAVLELTNAGRSTPIIPYGVSTFVGSVGVDAVIHFTRPSGSGRTSAPSPPPKSLDQPAVGALLQLGSAGSRSTRRISTLMSPKRAKASCHTTSVTVGACRGSALYASGIGDGGDGGGDIGATDALFLRQKGTPSTDDYWLIVIRPQTGGKAGNKVVPVTAETV